MNINNVSWNASNSTTSIRATDTVFSIHWNRIDEKGLRDRYPGDGSLWTLEDLSDGIKDGVVSIDLSEMSGGYVEQPKEGETDPRNTPISKEQESAWNFWTR